MATNRCELLATWYLRFNGYFTVPDFVVHKDYRNRPGGTDADILAVRFPNSCEYQRRFVFKHDAELVVGDKIDFVICEVKKGLCDLNDPWLAEERCSVEYVLRWMGFEDDEVTLNRIAGEIYHSGFTESARSCCSVRFLAIGNKENLDLKKKMPEVSQILFSHVIDFLRSRFTTRCEGINRQNWDRDIVEFADLCRVASAEMLLSWAGVSTVEHESRAK
jgi:hypothetical protein